MATLNLYSTGFDFNSPAHASWSVAYTSPAAIVLQDSQHFQQFVLLGNFSTSSGGSISGTVAQAELYSTGYAGQHLYSVTGLSVDAAGLVNLMGQATDSAPIFHALLGGNDTINGSPNDDVLDGYLGNDTIHAGAGNDTIIRHAGGDAIDGGAGIDSVNYDGLFADYRLEQTASGVTVAGLKGGVTVDTLANVEFIRFQDKVVAPVDVDSAGGEIYRLYRAAFGHAPDLDGFSWWLGQMDKGMKLGVVADAFIHSAEYQRAYGSLATNAEVVDAYYEHILHRAPDPAGLAYWTAQLDSHAASSAQVLAAFSESHENVEGSAALIGHGLVFDIPLMTH